MATSSGFAQDNKDRVGLVAGGHAHQRQDEAPADRRDASAGSNTRPDPQMAQKATRRRFTDVYKLSIIARADACTGPGEIGALLRQEGIFSSTLANFRKQKNQGLLDGSVRKTRVFKHPAVAEARAQQMKDEREIRALRRKLAHAERIIAIQKKAAILLGETLQDMNLNDMD